MINYRSILPLHLKRKHFKKPFKKKRQNYAWISHTFRALKGSFRTSDEILAELYALQVS